MKKNIGKNIVYHAIVFTDKDDFKNILLEYKNGNNIKDLFEKINSIKFVGVTVNNFIEIKNMEKNTVYYICIIEDNKDDYIYTPYPMALAETSTKHFIKKLK
jgi:hypothetical protein